MSKQMTQGKLKNLAKKGEQKYFAFGPYCALAKSCSFTAKVPAVSR